MFSDNSCETTIYNGSLPLPHCGTPDPLTEEHERLHDAAMLRALVRAYEARPTESLESMIEALGPRFEGGLAVQAARAVIAARGGESTP